MTEAKSHMHMCRLKERHLSEKFFCIYLIEEKI